MANSDKNIVITPNISQAAQPNVVFKGQGNVPITLKVLDDSYGTLSFEGSAGQLFSINNNLTSGIIFSVNDVSGIPQIDVNADGTIRIAPFGSSLQIAGLTLGRGSGGIVSNTVLGNQSFASCTTGVNNTAIGQISLANLTTGNNNTGIGSWALGYVSTTSQNTALGAEAGRLNTSGTSLTGVINCIYIGYQSIGTNSASNEIVIGAAGAGKGSNTTVLGNTSTTQTWLYGSNRLPYNSASSLSTFSVAKTVLGGIHFVNGAGSNTSTRNEAAITFQGTNETDAQAGIYVTNDNSTGTHMAFATTDSYATGPQLAVTISNTGVVNFPRAVPTYAGTAINYGTGTANYVTKYTGTSSQGSSQIFDNGTNVGVGTASPGAKLEIQSADGADALAMSGYKVMKWESSNHLVFGGYTAGQWQVLKFYTNGSERVRVTSGGLVGIGTSTIAGTVPLADLHVNDASGYGSLQLSQSPAGTTIDTGGEIQFAATYRSTSDLTQVARIRGLRENATNNNWAGYLAFYTSTGSDNPSASTERMRINSSGNVGIGTTSPGAKLQVDTGATGTKGQIIKAFLGQSANLQEWQDSSANILGAIYANGAAFFRGINVAASANGGTVTEVSGNFPTNNTSPYTTGAGSTASWGSGLAINGNTNSNDSNNTWIDANGEGGVTFIKVVFNATYVIDRVRLAGRYDASTGDGQPQEFQLDFSDGSVQKFTFPASYTGMQEYNIRPVTTSFIRYTTISKYSAGNNGLRELEAYTRYPAVNGSMVENRYIFHNVAKGSEVQTNVGIGTSSPQSTLDTRGLTILTNSAGANYNENLRLPESSSGYATIHMGGAVATSGTGANQWSILKTASGLSHRFEIRHNNSQYFTITTAGDVGINTTTPATKLHVDGGAGLPIRTVSSTFSGMECHITNGTWKAFIGTESGGGGNRYNSADNQHTFYNNSTAVMRINSSGYVGIGTTGPTKSLTIAQNGAAPGVLVYKSPDGTLNASQLTAALGSGSSSTNAGTSGGAEYGICQLFHNGTTRVQLYAYDVGVGNVTNFALDAFTFGTTTSFAQVGVVPKSNTTTGLTVRGFTGQTAALQTFQNSSGEVIDFVAADGYSSLHFGEIDWTPNYSGGVSSPSARTYQKTSGNANVWDGQVYSSQGFTKNVHVTFKPSQNNLYFMLGLNSDPSFDGVYNSLDYAWYCNADGYMYIYESGSQIGSNYGTYTSSTLLTVAYDGTNVTYYKDGAIMRQVARAVGNALYLDSSFYSANSAANSVRFGPLAPNVAAQGTANYVAKFNAANSLVNSSIQDDGTTVTITNALVANSVATPRYYSVGVNAGNAVRLGQWNVTEGNVALHIQVSSDTGAHSGTSSYLYQGGFNVISNTSGQYIKLLPLMIGRGHGDGPDNSISADSGGWTVFLYTGSTNPAYTMGVAVGVPTGKANKALRVTVTELRGGMTYTADGSSISYPTTSYPYSYQHTYGNLYSNGPIQSAYGPYLGASGYVSGGFIGVSKWIGMDGQYINIRKLYGTRSFPNTYANGDYVEIAQITRSGVVPVTLTIHLGHGAVNGQASAIYQFVTPPFSAGSFTIPPVNHITDGDIGFDIEAIVTNTYYLNIRARRRSSTTPTYLDFMFSIECHQFNRGAITEISGTGNAASAIAYGNTSQKIGPVVSSPPPVGGSGAGTNLTISASSGVTSGAGGSIILQPGAQATSGGDGYLQIKGQGTSTVIKLTESAYNRSFTWTQDYSGAFLSADGGLGGIVLFSRFYIDTGGKIRSAYNNYVGLGSSNSQNYDNWGYIYLRNDGVINWWGDVGLTYGSVGQIRVSNASTGGGSLAFTSSTASYSANQNDLVLTGSAFQRLSASGGIDRTITGIAPPSGGSHVDGRMMRIYNVGSANTLILAHNSTSSAAANRFWCVGQASITIALGDYAELIYDANDNGRGGAGWRVH